jgi:hypothetical protein
MGSFHLLLTPLQYSCCTSIRNFEVGISVRTVPLLLLIPILFHTGYPVARSTLISVLATRLRATTPHILGPNNHHLPTKMQSIKMSDTTKPSDSLADHITQPTPASVNGSSSTLSPSATPAEAKGSTSWADEVASPVGGDDKSNLADEVASPVGGDDKSNLADVQVDGAAEPQGGSQLHDTQYEVEVKLSDIQGDENSPLFSISSFEELGMRVFITLGSYSSVNLALEIHKS